MHLLHRGGRDGPMDDRKADVFQAGGTHGRGLVERAWLHGIAIVEDDLAACGLERLDLLLGRLAACNPSGHWLGGVGETGESRE